MFPIAYLDTLIDSCVELSGAILATDNEVPITGTSADRITAARDSFDPIIGQFYAASEQRSTPDVTYKNVVMNTTQFAGKVRQLVQLGCISGGEMALVVGIFSSVHPDYEVME